MDGAYVEVGEDNFEYCIKKFLRSMMGSLKELRIRREHVSKSARKKFKMATAAKRRRRAAAKMERG